MTYAQMLNEAQHCLDAVDAVDSYGSDTKAAMVQLRLGEAWIKLAAEVRQGAAFSDEQARAEIS